MPNTIQCLQGEGKGGQGKSKPFVSPVFLSYKWNPPVEDFHAQPGGKWKERLEMKKSG